MILDQGIKGKVLRRCRVYGIPEVLGNHFGDHVYHMETNNGPEWTVSRLKAVKQSLIDYLADRPSRGPAWFRRDRRYIFGGRFRPLMKYAMKSRGNAHKVINLIQAYSVYRSPKVTPTQWSKFINGVHCKSGDPTSSFPSKVMKVGLLKSGLMPTTLDPSDIPSVLTVDTSPSRRCPSVFGSNYEDKSYLDSVLSPLIINPYGEVIYNLYGDLIDRALLGLNFDPKKAFVFPSLGQLKPGDYRLRSVYGGSIGFIQEPGFKLRSVANPARLHQLVLKPLGDSLFSKLKSLPWDCTFDQSKPIPVLQEALRAGTTVHSVDLSSATDMFPLGVQLQALRYLYGSDDPFVEYFLEVSRGWWSIPSNVPSDLEYVSWTQGQPLGLYPSFASFGLSHGLLLLGLLGTEKWNNHFFILGDDVVILDSDLHSKYRYLLTVLGCEVSESKSISSSHLCEFAGLLIFPDAVVPQLKWKDMSDDSFISICSLLGPSSLPLLTPRQKRVVNVISVLPKELGGLGWNKEGVPLVERLSKYWHLWNRDPAPREPLTDLSSIVNGMVYPSRAYRTGFINVTSDAGDLIQTFDQKVLSEITHALPGLSGMYRVLGRNAWMVTGGEISLPIRGHGRHQSTLEILENLLRSFGYLS